MNELEQLRLAHDAMIVTDTSELPKLSSEWLFHVLALEKISLMWRQHNLFCFIELSQNTLAKAHKSSIALESS